MSGKYALIIGNTEYIDSGLAQLTAPGKDAEDFARVLKDKEISAFDDVKVIVNEPSALVIESIDEFFDQKKPDDLLVLYFSGHGIRDEIGSLYLAFKNTIRTRLRATAIKADYIRESMDQSRSKRQVLILDCCNSGAFPPGTKAELGGAMGITRAFQGYGRFVLTASDATQFAWEGDQVIGTQTDNSLFTHFLVKGLEGEADNDGDGQITVDEIYDYAFQKISQITPNQTPTKSASKQAGEIVLRENMRFEDIKPVALPDDLISEIEDLRPSVRESAVRWLETIVKGKNIGMARSAIDALEKVASDENTTRRVSEMAMRVIESVRAAEKKAEEERKAREEAERRAALEAEEKRLTFEKAEAERKAKEEAEKLARAKAEREAAEQEAARLKAEREEAEKAARDATEKASKEKAEKEALDRETALKAERDAMDFA
ncbi:MAG TPA: caspase family protein, partial [Anaerolineales bacterium]|nr:caspase family protein [Anaerolineales bacterium]